MNGVSGDRDKVGNVFVAVVEIVGEHTGGGKEDERPGGDGLGGIPDVGVEEGVIGATELLDAEVVVVDETLEKVGISRLGTHFNAAPHTVEGHGNHGIAGLPTDGAVFGIVDDRPNARLGFDEGLIAIRVILGREVVDGDILIEVVGGVGLAFGGRAVSHLAYTRGRMYSDVVVGIAPLDRPLYKHFHLTGNMRNSCHCKIDKHNYKHVPGTYSVSSISLRNLTSCWYASNMRCNVSYASS